MQLPGVAPVALSAQPRMAAGIRLGAHTCVLMCMCAHMCVCLRLASALLGDASLGVRGTRASVHPVHVLMCFPCLETRSCNRTGGRQQRPGWQVSQEHVYTAGPRRALAWGVRLGRCQGPVLSLVARHPHGRAPLTLIGTAQNTGHARGVRSCAEDGAGPAGLRRAARAVGAVTVRPRDPPGQEALGPMNLEAVSAVPGAELSLPRGAAF